MTRKWIGAILLTITCLAAFLRFYRLDVLPPGLFGDEALVTLHAREAVAAGRYPLYFVQSDGGFHPAIGYLTILMRWLTNNHPYAVRFGIATAGVLSIPLVYLALRAIFRLDFDEGRSEAAALLGAGILAITFPYILINRLGFEVMLPAPAGALAFYFLARGLNSRRRTDFALAGGALGLSLYTYYSARLLPAAIVLAVVWAALAGGRAMFKAGLVNLAIVAIASAIVFAPLGIFFLQNPAVFFTRAASTGEQTLGQGLLALPLSLLNSTARTLASISINGFGDFIPRHNLPLRAVYDPFLSLLFWAGLGAALLHARRRSSALLVSWFLAMQLPVILTMQLNSPHFTRMTGAFPAMAGLCALGALAFYNSVAGRNERWAFGLLGIELALSLSISTYDYFGRWATHPGLYDAFQVGDWQAATLALDQSQRQIVLLSPELLDNPAHPSFDVRLEGSSVRQFPGPDCLAYFDRPQKPLTYIVDALNDRQTFDRVHALFPEGREGATIFHPVDGWPLYQIFEVPAGAGAVTPQHPSSANFGDQVRLTGYSLSQAAVQPGDSIVLVLYWQAIRLLDADYNAFIHLYAADLSVPLAQTDGPPCGGHYTTSRWETGEIVIDERRLTLPPDFPGGIATIGVGLYGWPSLERLPISGGEPALPDHRLLLAQISIPR